MLIAEVTAPLDITKALADEVAARLADGALGDTVLGRPDWAVPNTLAADVRALVEPAVRAEGFAVVQGLFDHCPEPGRTPDRWSEAAPRQEAARDVTLALVSSCLGQTFGWQDQQAGRIIHNIVPSVEYQHMQVGASSTVPLEWHTEDAFHPDRADLLLLTCVKNPDAVGTRLARIRDVRLERDRLDQLRRPLVCIEPDDSYEDEDAATMERVGMATVWDSDNGLCVRYDPSYARLLTDDPEFASALDALGHAFEECAFIVPLGPGDLLVVDNDAAVHGRVAFQPRYDGTDRWLKRSLVRTARRRPAAEDREHGYHQLKVVP